MPEIQSAGGAVWADGASVQAVGGAAWADGASLQSIGSSYAAPSAPGGGTTVTVGSLAAMTEIVPATHYRSNVTVVVTNLRTDDPISATSGSISIEDGGTLWRLSAEVPRAAYDAMRSGDQPPLVGVMLAGRQWAFVVDSMSAPRAFASDNVTIAGVSLAALADAPYELARTWINDAPSTAAQIAALAQTFTELDVRWRAPDWAIPAGKWSYSGTPWGAALSVAAAIEAVVEADPSALAVTVSSRYPVMPNQWATTPPDAQIPWVAVLRESVDALRRPGYTGVYVAGAAETVAAVRLAGTSGAEQAPMIVSELLTDLDGQVEMARTTLAQSATGETVTRTLQVLTGAGEPGMLQRGQLVRWVDPDATWTGMVRSTRVDWRFADVWQTVSCERRLSFPIGAFVPEPDPVVTDPSWTDVILLLPCDSDVINVASGGIQFVNTGTTISSTAKFGGGSLALNGTSPGGGGPNGLVNAAVGSSAGWGLTEGDFTVEVWVYLQSNVTTSYAPILRTSSAALGTEVNFRIDGTNALEVVYVSSAGGTSQITAGSTIPLNTWTHVALCRSASTYRLWMGGVLQGSLTSAYSAAASMKSVQIGTVGALAPDALFDDMRVTKSARYTAPFTPPTAAHPTS